MPRDARYVEIPSTDRNYALGGVFQKDGTFDVLMVRKGSYFFRHGLKVKIKDITKWCRMVLALAQSFEEPDPDGATLEGRKPPLTVPVPIPDDDDEHGGFGGEVKKDETAIARRKLLVRSLPDSTEEDTDPNYRKR